MARSLEADVANPAMLGDPQNLKSESPSNEPERSARETLASMVYQRLFADIIGGRLEPGHKLVFRSLRETYGVGAGPLRDALTRLAIQGLVVYEKRKGFRVAPASVEELLEIIKTRCWLEEDALRESIRYGDHHWEERVMVAYHRLSRALRPEDESLYALTDERFR